MPEQGGRSLRVLIVEDNPDAAESLALWLELEGYELRVAWSGADARHQARVFGPHIVLLDLGLPDADGYELGVALRQLPETASARFFAVSGYPPDPARAAAARFDEHLVKPVDPAQVAAVLARYARGLPDA